MSKGERLVGQAGTLYKVLYDNSEIITLDAGDPVRIWKGAIVNTALEAGIPYGSYGAVVKALIYLGCIQQVQSGARNNPSVYVLHTEPTEQLWASYDDSAAQALTKRAKSASLAAEAERLIKTLGGVNLGKVLKNYEDRITALETAVSDLKSNRSSRSRSAKSK